MPFRYLPNPYTLNPKSETLIPKPLPLPSPPSPSPPPLFFLPLPLPDFFILMIPPTIILNSSCSNFILISWFLYVLISYIYKFLFFLSFLLCFGFCMCIFPIYNLCTYFLFTIFPVHNFTVYVHISYSQSVCIFPHNPFLSVASTRCHLKRKRKERKKNKST